MKKLLLEIPEYNPAKGMEYLWEDGFTISTDASEVTISISANKQGLISLAKQLLTLAELPVGGHLHYDTLNSLEDGSIELIVNRIG